VNERTLDAERVDAWAREHLIACLYFLADGAPGVATDAEDAGYRLVDVRVELSRSPAAVAEATLREAVPDDLATLRALARGNHRVTRFYADPRFPDDRCDDLYETWIERSVEGWADVVLVAEAGGKPVGYVSCHVTGDAGSIGLVGVAETARGRGLGRTLVDAAVTWCRERDLARVSVVAQGRNARALRLYENCGFRTTDVGLWFHRWFDW
jgi:dTDP-4-amino-4,6-dideoxy-D-galactose acyltransferase